MKKVLKSMILVIILIACLEVKIASAQENVSITLSSKIWTKYLGTNGFVYHEEPVIQTDLFISLPKGFYVDIWHSVGLDDNNLSSNYGNELDYTLGWSGEIKGFLFDTGISYFDIYKTFENSGEDIIQPYVVLSKEIPVSNSVFSPYLKAELPFSAKNSNSKGIYLYAGINHLLELTEKLSVNHEMYFLHDNGAFGLNSGIIGGYNAGLSYNISNHVILEPILIKTTTPLFGAELRKTETVFGSGITFNF